MITVRRFSIVKREIEFDRTAIPLEEWPTGELAVL